MTVQWSQGLEMYITMIRFGKACIRMTDPDEGRIGGKANEVDQTNRVLDYFDYYLKRTTCCRLDFERTNLYREKESKS